MPWDAKTGAGVGLFAWCALVLKWMVIVEQDQVEDVTGEVDPDFLRHVMRKIAEVNEGRNCQ